MRLLFILISLIAGGGIATAQMEHNEAHRDVQHMKGIKLKSQDRILFFGDSITASGTRPGGYVSIVTEAIAKSRPQEAIEVIGAGVSGNKVPDLLKRLQSDVLSKEPDIVFIYIGINDVWHWSKPHPVTKEKREGTTAEAYEQGIRQLVSDIQQAGATVVLCTPTVISEQINPQDENYQRLEHYATIVREIASDMGTGLLDFRALFISYLNAHNHDNLKKGVLTWDEVHLNARGNELIAEAVCNFLKIPLQAEGDTQAVAFSENMDLYLLLGQSNMAGRAPLSPEYAKPIPNTYLLNGRNDWEPARNPLNRHSTIRKNINMQKLGLGYAFASKMHQASPETTIGLVVNARGGSKIEQWQKGTLYYRDALQRIQVAQHYGTLKGILWHQGEANFEDPAYQEKLIQLISDFRADLKLPDLPFIVGEITGEHPVIAQLRDLPNHVQNTACVSAEGLITYDRWHFDTESQILLGERYAEAVLSLIADIL